MLKGLSGGSAGRHADLGSAWRSKEGKEEKEARIWWQVVSQPSIWSSRYLPACLLYLPISKSTSNILTSDSPSPSPPAHPTHPHVFPIAQIPQKNSNSAPRSLLTLTSSQSSKSHKTTPTHYPIHPPPTSFPNLTRPHPHKGSS